MNRYTLLSLLLVISAIGMFGQSHAQSQLGLHLQTGMKSAALADAGYRDAWGGNLEWLSPELLKSRIGSLRLGGQASFLGAGGHKEAVILAIPEGAAGTLRIQNNQFLTHGMARLITPDAPVQVYVDGMLGARAFLTQEEAEITDLAPGYEDTDSRTVLGDWGLSYGGAAGLMVRLTQDLRLDARASYLQRSDARFVDLRSATAYEQSMAYNFTSAPSGQWFFQLGLNITLREGVYSDSDDDCPCNCGGSSRSSSTNSRGGIRFSPSRPSRSISPPASGGIIKH